MATFNYCVRPNKRRKDGFYQVLIRVTQNRESAFIRTDKYVNDYGLSTRHEIKDPYVVQYCVQKITHWMDRLNRVDCSEWGVKEIVEFIKEENCDLSFSEYAREFTARMYNNGMERTSRNYRYAYEHLERYAGTTKVTFSMLTSVFLRNWIATMEHTHRAKEKYPICIRQIFKSAIKEFNDEEKGVFRIKFNPWSKVDIPRPERAEQLAISPEECRAFFNAPLPESEFVWSVAEFGRDVAMLSFCLAGMNTVDLYNLKKVDYYDGVIHYKRAKTKKFRRDEAYMEMRVHPIIRPLFEKYASDADDEYLFNFHKRFATSDSMGASANKGIRRLCECMGMDKDDWYCVYTFRHTWGTIAQNDCGASLAEVGFGMNHSTAHRVTRGYVKLDFSPAWELNDRVVELVFFTQIKGSRTKSHVEREVVFERFSPMNLIRGEVFFRGELLGMVEDTGFNNIENVIKLLVPYVKVREDIPERCHVMFRLTNLDKKQTGIYERMKGGLTTRS